MNDKAMMTMRFAGMAFCWADMLFELDREHKIVFSVGATDRLLGVGPADLMGQPFLPFIDERDRDLIAELLNVTVSSGRIDEPSARMALANETVTEVSLSGYRTPDFDDHFFLAVKVAPRRVPIQQRRAEDRDEAADVLSEGSFASVAADRIKSYQAAGGKPKVSMIKIDNMEELKGKLTSENQETMMATIGTIIKEHSLGKDTAGRIDDENFSLVHGEDVTPEMISQEIAASTADLDPDGVGLTTQSTTVDADVSALSEAEMTRALVYTMREFSKDPANVGGGNSLDGMLQRRVHETAKMVASFKRVCSTGHFDLVYMPICDLKTGVIHHFEALTRFRGGDGTASPYELITMAEEVGIIPDFDYAVAKKAIQFIKEQPRKIPSIAVNVSGNSIVDPDFIAKLHDLLDRVGDISDRLMFEITESAGIEDLEGTNITIQSLRTKGYKVSLDDFGAGAASFDYLNSFDIDTVKFDGPVVKRAYATDKGKAFLASMATLCKQTGIETIAEMVEDEPLAKFLSECGVDLGQGWYFGKPDGDIHSFDLPDE